MDLDKVTADVLEELNRFPVIDAHERLPREEAVADERRDFYTLFHHYCTTGLVSAGAGEEDVAVFRKQEQCI